MSNRPSDCHPEKPNVGRGLCGTCYARAWRSAHPGRNAEVLREWRKLNPGRQAAYDREYVKSHPGAQALNSRRSAYRRLYGISIEDYDRMLLEQGGGCRICGALPPEGKRLHVDHDHGTEAQRGLLCYLCNSGLGMFQDNPGLLARAIEYLTP